MASRGEGRGRSPRGEEAHPSDTPAPPEVTVEYINTYAEIYDMPSKVVKAETYSKSVQTTMVSTGTQPEEFDDDAPRRDGGGHETENETWSRMVEQLDEERRQLERELKELKAKTDNLQLQRESPACALPGMRFTRGRSPFLGRRLGSQPRIVPR